MLTRSSGHRNQTLALLAILSLALIIRLVYLWLYQALPDWDQLTVDNYYHHHWAQSLADGDLTGGTTYFRAPGYVYALGFLYWLFGSSLWVGRLFGLAIGLASITMTYLLGKRLFDHRTGLVAAALHTIFPVIIYFESELLLDPLFMLLAQLMVYRLLIWLKSGQGKDALWTGVMIGLAAVTRPTALAFVPFVILFSLFSMTMSLGKRAGHLLLMVVATGIVILPITIRNIVVASDPVLIASQGGINFYIGNNRSADGSSAIMPDPLGHNWRLEDVAYIARKETGHVLSPGDLSEFWYRKGIEEITADPMHFARLLGVKLYRSISNLEISNNRSLGLFFSRLPLLRYNPLSFGIIFALAVVGAALSWRKPKDSRWLVWFILSQVAVTALFFFNSRFRLPLLPFYILLASHGLLLIVAAAREHRMRLLKLLLSTAALAIVSYVPLIGLTPGVSTQDMLSKALMYMNRGDYPTATGLLRRASQFDSNFPTTNLNLGICYLRQGQTDSAFHYFTREKELHPQRPRAYINTASLYLVNGRIDSALTEIDRAISLRPYDITANRILLRAAAAGDITNDSLSILVGQAVSRTGANIYLLNEAALLLLQRGEIIRAEQLFRQAAEASPPPIETDNSAFDADYVHSKSAMRQQRARAYYQLGYIHGRSGQYDVSIDYSRRAIELDPILSEAYVNLISGYLSTGRRAEADSTLAAALKKFPDDSQLRQLSDLVNRTRER